MSADARGYKWADAEPGNRLAERHGAWSERRWRPVSERLAAEIVDECPWLARPSFALAVKAWSVAEAKASLVDDWLSEHGLLDPDGIPRPANALADRLHARAITLRGQLGLDPVSLAKLLATFAGVPGGEDALALLKAEGARLVSDRSSGIPGARHPSAALSGVSQPEAAL